MEKTLIQNYKCCPVCKGILDEIDYVRKQCIYCNSPLHDNFKFSANYNYLLTSPPPQFKKGKPKFKHWKLFSMTPEDVIKCMKKQITYGEFTQDDKFNFMYVTGEIPVLLVAHVDTVHKALPKVEHDKEKNVLWSETGLGADDRAGVAAILEIIDQGYRPHILLCNGEESGGIGAKLASKNLKAPSVNCIIELDRQGAEDSVYYDCDNEDFEKYINSFGFKTAFGSFSDISFLCPEWGIAGVNLSIGYYGAHTSAEYLKINEWQNTVNKVIEILKNPPTEAFEYIEKYSSYYDSYYSSYTDLSMSIDGIKAYIDIYDLVDLFGGNEDEWFKYLLDNENYIQHKLTDKIWEALDEVIETIPPNFLY
jgi:hypothetical protein